MQYNGKYSLRSQLLNEGWFGDIVKKFKSELSDDMEEDEILDDLIKDEELKELNSIGKKKVETWEELRLVLNFILHEDKIIEELERSEHAGTGVGLIIKGIWGLTSSFFPPFAVITQMMGVAKDLKGYIDRSHEITQNRSQKKIESNPYLDALMLDAGYSQVMDNALEKRMLQDFLKELNDNKELTGPIEDEEGSFTSWAENWIEEHPEIAGQITLTGAQDKGKFTDISIPDLSGNDVKKILNALGSMAFNAI